MSPLDDITRSIKGMYNKIAVDTKRTAAITKLRMELTGLDRQRREFFIRLGEKVNELRRTNQITDAGLLGLLEIEFDNLDRVSKRMDETMAAIQELNLSDEEPGEEVESEGDGKMEDPDGSLLDSFDVT